MDQIETRRLTAEEKDWLLRNARPRPPVEPPHNGQVTIAVLAGCAAGTLIGLIALPLLRAVLG